MSAEALSDLESVVEELIQRCKSLQEQNSRLIKTHEQWMEERRRLFKKFESVENCIDQTISKLQSMQANA